MKTKIHFHFIFVMVCLFIGATAVSQNIYTVAGNGSIFYSGENVPALTAGMYPAGVAFDASGNLYIADWGNGRIRKVDWSGTITTVAGGGGSLGDGGLATMGAINMPVGLTFDLSGNLLIADSQNSRIRKVDALGIITTIAGTGVAGFSGDGGVATSAQLNNPTGIAVNSAGDIFIAEYDGNRIRKINTSGIISTVAGNGIGTYSGDGLAASLAQVNGPWDLIFDTSGNLLITDWGNNRIRKINSLGNISTIVGTGVAGFSGDGGTAIAAEITEPTGLALDVYGNIYFGDSFNNRIRMVDVSGNISTIAGNGSVGYSGDSAAATLAELGYIRGMAFDSYGCLFVASNLSRVRQISLAGCSGILEIEKSDLNNATISVYPNPANENIHVSFSKVIEKETTLKITDVMGREVLFQQFDKLQGSVSVNIADLPAGVYFLSVGAAKKIFVKQ